MTGTESEPQRNMTEEEWIQAFLDKCEPLSQRQLDIVTYEFQKAADEMSQRVIPTTDTEMSDTPG